MPFLDVVEGAGCSAVDFPDVVRSTAAFSSVLDFGLFGLSDFGLFGLSGFGLFGLSDREDSSDSRTVRTRDSYRKPLR